MWACTFIFSLFPTMIMDYEYNDKIKTKHTLNINISKKLILGIFSCIFSARYVLKEI
jgi:hypothetical protein